MCVCVNLITAKISDIKAIAFPGWWTFPLCDSWPNSPQKERLDQLLNSGMRRNLFKPYTTNRATSPQSLRVSGTGLSSCSTNPCGTHLLKQNYFKAKCRGMKAKVESSHLWDLMGGGGLLVSLWLKTTTSPNPQPKP